MSKIFPKLIGAGTLRFKEEGAKPKIIAMPPSTATNFWKIFRNKKGLQLSSPIYFPKTQTLEFHRENRREDYQDLGQNSSRAT